MDFLRITLALLVLLAGNILSDAEEPDTANSRFRILNSSGEPVSGATVRLIHQTQDFRELIEHELVHLTTTDEDGYFQLPPGKQVANAQEGGGGFSATWITLPARDGKPERTWLLGTSAGAYSPYMKMIYRLFSNPKKQVTRERMREMHEEMVADKNIPTTYTVPEWETTIRVVNHDGPPATGVTVTPLRVVWLSIDGPMKAIFVPPQLRESLRQTTNEDGLVTFTTIARNEFTELEFESPRHGIQRTFTNSNSIGDVLDKDLMLFPSGTVAGTVKTTDAAGQAFLKGKKLLFRSRIQNSGLRFPEGRPIPMHGYAEVTVDEDGRFEIPAMLMGKLTLYDRFQQDSPIRITFPADSIVQPDKTNTIDGQVISTVLVRGVLKKRDTGEPVPRALVTIRHGKQSGISRELSVNVTTDENGQFETRVFPGIIGYSPLTVVPGYVAVYRWEQSKAAPRQIPYLPQGQRATVPCDVDEFTLPPLELVPTTTLTGTLIDVDGQPVPDTGIYGYPAEHRANCDFARTNSDGLFTMDRIPTTYPPTSFKAGEQHKTKPVSVVSRQPLVLQLPTQ